jgi:hypothetical protein
MRGKPITASAVAKRLKSFGIAPRTIKLSNGVSRTDTSGVSLTTRLGVICLTLQRHRFKAPQLPIFQKHQQIRLLIPQSSPAVSGWGTSKSAQPIEKYSVLEVGSFDKWQFCRFRMLSANPRRQTRQNKRAGYEVWMFATVQERVFRIIFVYLAGPAGLVT